MKKVLLYAAGIVVLSVALLKLYPMSYKPGVNPDPNHTHVDFAVWVNGTQLDFSDARYMSEAPVPAGREPATFIPSAFAHEAVELGGEENVDPSRKYLHLHDGNGHVIHRHKPGLTLGDFFTSLGISMTSTCMTLDDFQFSKLDQAWVKDFARTKELCNDGKFHWTMMVNGTRMTMTPAYDFADTDKILLSYGSSDTAADEQYKKLSDDACMYSQTCPERGEPPTENCIADPAVPCVAPLD